MPIEGIGINWEYTENGIKNIAKSTGIMIGYMKIKKGQTVKLGLILFSKPSTSTSFTLIDKKTGTNINTSSNFSNFQSYKLNTKYERTFTAEEDCEVSYSMYGNADSEIFEFQLWAEYNELTDYTKHEEESYVLYIQKEMLKGDYFIKEADGWKEVHGTGIYETDEEDNWQMNTSGLYFLYNAIKSSNTNNTALSTHFKFNSRTSGMNVLGDGEFALQPQYDNNPIYCKDNSSATLQDFKNRLATEKVKFYYNLATPTKLDCTEEQSAVLEELNNMDLFEGVNNIITAEDIALLKLKYALDVEIYIDNKLNTIN